MTAHDSHCSPSRGAVALLLLCALPLVAAACDQRSDSPLFDYRPPADAGDADAAVEVGLWEPGAPLCIATFNVERLFDTVCDSGHCERGDYEALLTDTQLTIRATQIADGIAALDCDIVLLQEVESEAALDAVLQHLTGRYRAAVLGETGEPASIDVAVIANGAIWRVVSHTDEVLHRPNGTETSFARDLLEVHLGMSAGALADGRTEVIVFAAHFKSKSNDDPGRRLAEAEAAHDIVRSVAEAHPDALVVLGGDLNDVPGSPPIDALEGDGELLRVAADRPLDAVATYVFGGQLQSIDHLFLAEEGAGAYVPSSAQSFHGQTVWGYGGSDHAALRAEFLLE